MARYRDRSAVHGGRSLNPEICLCEIRYFAVARIRSTVGPGSSARARRLGDQARAALAGEIRPEPLALHAQPLSDVEAREPRDPAGTRISGKRAFARCRSLKFASAG